MKNLCVWSDDHLPCFSFEHNNRSFELWWSSSALEGKLELVEDGDIPIEKAFKDLPQTLKVINNPDLDDGDSEIEFEREGDKKSYGTECQVYVYDVGAEPVDHEEDEE